MELKFRELYSKVPAETLRENRHITNITQLLLSGEGFLTRAVRCAGAREKFVTGDGSDYEKFRELCRLAPLFAGNPAQFVCSYILRRFFGCELELSPENCDEIWTRTADILAEKPLTPSDVLRTLNVGEISVTTGASADLSTFDGSGVNVTPSICPDAVFAADKRGYKKIIAELGDSEGLKIDGISSFERALLHSVERFADKNCRFALLGQLSREDFGKSDYYHADLALGKAISTDGNITPEEASHLRRYAVKKFIEACRDRKINVLLEFSERSVEILPDVRVEPVEKRRVRLNFGETEREIPTVTEGSIDICGNVGAQLEEYARRYAIGTLPPFFVGTANLAELCLHELYLSELRRFSEKARGTEIKNL